MAIPKYPIPPEYDQDTLTRLFEDVYDGQEKTNNNWVGAAEALRTQIETIGGQFGDFKSGIENARLATTQSPCPKPEGVTIWKAPLIPMAIVTCLPVDPLRYPNVKGFQFYGSTEENFPVLDESGQYTITFYQDDVAGSATVVTVSDSITANPNLFTEAFTDCPFWSFQHLVDHPDGAYKVVNVTDNSSGTITAWENYKITVGGGLSGGSDNTFQHDDQCTITLWRRSTLIGQGPLPFAVYFIPNDENIIENPKYDVRSFYAKVRTYSDKGQSQLACASTTGHTGLDPEINGEIVVNAQPYNEKALIHVDWTQGVTDGELNSEIRFYNLYRTNANNTALITRGNYIHQSTTWTDGYDDSVYDAVTNPGGVEPGTIYYYWVSVVNTQGEESTEMSDPDGASLEVPAQPTIYSGAVESAKGHGQLQNFVVKWICTGSPEGYWVKYRKKLNGTYGEYTVPVYVPHTDVHGQYTGEDIQQYTFIDMNTKTTYTFSVQATNNPQVPGMGGTAATQDYLVGDSSAPDAPS